MDRIGDSLVKTSDGASWERRATLGEVLQAASPYWAYWSGLTSLPLGDRCGPVATFEGDAAFVDAETGAQLTVATGWGESGAINWKFAHLPFFSASFYTKAGGGTGGDAVWFHFLSGNVPTDEVSCDGYSVFLSEYHEKVGISHGHWTDWSGTGGENQPLAMVDCDDLDDGYWHNIVVEMCLNRIVVCRDGDVLIDFRDSVARDITGENIGVGARFGASTNDHFVRGIAISKRIAPSTELPLPL